MALSGGSGSAGGGPRLIEERRGEVAVLSISNPDKRNALHPDLLLGLEAALARLADDGVRAVVLRGEGHAIFSSGYDIGAIRGGSGEEASRHPLGRAMRAVEEFPFPVLALVFGGAWGAAVELLAACDLRFAEPRARFAVPAAKLSVVYDAEGVARIASRTSRALVAELLLTARPVSAERAHDLGLLNGLHPADELESAVLALAAEIATLAPRTLRTTKQMLGLLTRREAFDPADVARFVDARDEAIASADFAEGQAAFAAKRPPRFTGG
ncbi:MAG: enoyl-CoA hydratase-related protein [Alphaproteobacteria bacterium]